MKKFLSLVLVLVLLILSAIPAVSAESKKPSTTINLVYDDSGSMIETDGVYVDTWCQAKYAMEVFAAMLGENDSLNIYYMSDYVDSESAAPKIKLTGSTDASVTASNVKKIHNTVTDASGTPYKAVKKAYNDLTKAKTDNKWLVVLTDGEFNDCKSSTVGNNFHKYVKVNGIKVVMLSMGPNAASVKADENVGIYSETAADSKDILGKLTSICNHIFQNNELPLNNLTSEFGVPMGQLTVFAQGENVKIDSITDAQGNKYSASSNVKVEYSKKATTDPAYPASKVVVADDLMGYVATFNYDFQPGQYNFNVTGADNVKVYYKPNVTIATYLYDDDGTEVTAEENLISGTYRVEYGFLNASTGERVTDTSLLGDILYSSVMTNTTRDGNVNTQEVNSGDTITIKEGTLDIDVSARFLEYNVVNTHSSYTVYSRSDLIFTLIEDPEYILNTEGFVNPDDPIIIDVKINDGTEEKELTAEQWALLGTIEAVPQGDVGPFRIEKSEAIGEFRLYPTLKDGDPMKTATGEIEYLVSGDFTEGLSSATGKAKGTLKIRNDISDWDRFMNWLERNWKWLTILIILLIILLGYIPPFKKYLPRKLKKRPTIECSAEKIGLKDREAHGNFKRNLGSTLIPYKAETGAVTFSPSPHKKVARLKAAGGGGMYVTNTKIFAGKEDVTFNGVSIEENRTKPYRIGSTSTISLKTNEYLYTCYLNR